MYEGSIHCYTHAECEHVLPAERTPQAHEFLAHPSTTDHRALAYGWGHRCRLSLYCGAVWQA